MSAAGLARQIYLAHSTELVESVPGLSVGAVPDDLLEAVHRLDFPVVEVPLATPCAAIVKVVSDRQAGADLALRAGQRRVRA